MKTPIRNIAIACAAIGSLASLHAADIDQTVNNQQWNNAIWGTPASAPTGGNDYFSVSSGTLSTTPFTTNGTTWNFGTTMGTVRDTANTTGPSTIFGGDSLTVVTNTRLLGKFDNGSTSEVDLVFGGGFYMHGGNGGGSAILDGTISFASGINLGAVALNPNSTTSVFTLTVSSAVLGDASDTLQLTLQSEGASVGTGNRLGQLIFNGDITGFGGTLYVGTATNGTNASSFYSVQSSSVSTTLQLDYEASNNFRYNLATDETFGSLILGGMTLGAATYDAAALNALTGGSEFFGAGTITVVPEPATYAVGMLGLVALAAAMRRKRNA